MIVTAVLTDSHKTDIRDQDERIVDSLLEKQNRENKEPLAQFYGVTVPIEFKTSNDLTNLTPQPSLNNFLVPNYTAIDYQPTNTILTWFNKSTFNQEILGFSFFSGIDLIINTNWFSRPSPLAFSSNFSFILYLNLYDVTGNGFNDYTPLLQIPLETITYTALTQEFTRSNRTLKYELKNTAITSNPNEIAVTQAQYDKIVAGQSRIAFIIGFDGSTLNTAQKTFMYGKIFIDETSIIFLYKGVTKL